MERAIHVGTTLYIKARRERQKVEEIASKTGYIILI
jgi:hypothetical protein